MRWAASHAGNDRRAQLLCLVLMKSMLWLKIRQDFIIIIQDHLYLFLHASSLIQQPDTTSLNRAESVQSHQYQNSSIPVIAPP
jgi:hypothetical protein